MRSTRASLHLIVFYCIYQSFPRKIDTNLYHTLQSNMHITVIHVYYSVLFAYSHWLYYPDNLPNRIYYRNQIPTTVPSYIIDYRLMSTPKEY